MSNKQPHHTKSGPGRRHKQGDGNREHTRTFAQSLMKVWADRRSNVMRKAKAVLRDEHGVFTLIGRDPLRQIDITGHDVRRVWLAGISARRGY